MEKIVPEDGVRQQQSTLVPAAQLALTGPINKGRNFMQSDFLDAHNRHLDDAEILFANNRWANADHLYGFATECGLKQLMLAFGMPFDADRNMPQDRADKQHVNVIWTRYETYRSGHHQGAGYVLPTTLNPFQDWHESQRYANQSNFDQARTEPHRNATKQVQVLIRKALREGLPL